MSLPTKWLGSLFHRKPLQAFKFPATGYKTIKPSYVLEEEQLDEFKAGRYYPVNIGDVYASKYQVLGKLGFGTTSTVWMARNFQDHSHVALKVYVQDGGDMDELKIYGDISRANPAHPGIRHVRTALDKFTLESPDGGKHECLVQQPMWDSWKDLLHRNQSRRFSEPLLKAGLMQLLLGLDYLHTECKLVHTGNLTDIKADNVLQELVDEQLIEAFVKDEMESPSPRKFVNGIPVYKSRKFDRPKIFGNVVLSDFGSAVRGDKKRNHDAQPDVYRSPEVMLKIGWSYPVDIWNLGAMIWDLFERRHLFYGDDPSGEGYMTRAHLAEVIGMIGEWKAEIPIPDMDLNTAEQFLEGKNHEGFLTFRYWCYDGDAGRLASPTPSAASTGAVTFKVGLVGPLARLGSSLAIGPLPIVALELRSRGLETDRVREAIGVCAMSKMRRAWSL
ncbi:hypothetical protein G7046_g120 [Stylonectria norvegica]|nr:hypothetical protein G7046_g120 [Stylonectria norvegica]